MGSGISKVAILCGGFASDGLGIGSATPQGKNEAGSRGLGKPGRLERKQPFLQL